jgi:hypothetical protein
MASNNNDEERVKPFSEFVDSVQSARHDQYIAKKGKRVANTAAFAEMKAHLTNRYKDVEVVHSFMDESGTVFDCIPFEQQPSLKSLRMAKPKSPPEAPDFKSPPEAPKETERLPAPKENAYQIEPPLSPERKDKFGNTMFCPPGTVPLRRITLDVLAGFETLQDFFQKSPDGRSQTPPNATAPSVEGHRYAHASQFVGNQGGHSILFVARPSVNTSIGQVFSLSQHWYVGGSGMGSDLQTVEIGWHVYPNYWGGNSSPHLFIFWTPNNYNRNGPGSYNLDRPGFIRNTSSSWPLGVDLSSYIGRELEIACMYAAIPPGWGTAAQFGWWLYVGGTSASNAIGVYPNSLYGNGPLASGQASVCDYGGETCSDDNSYSQMGNGIFGDSGTAAAYQRDINYLNSGGTPTMASLTLQQPSPLCYRGATNLFATPWNETLHYGGPGGTSC